MSNLQTNTHKCLCPSFFLYFLRKLWMNKTTDSLSRHILLRKLVSLP